MDIDNNSFSIFFHWSGEVWAVTIISLVFIIGGVIYIETINWPTWILWLKYLIIVPLCIAIVIGVCYMPIRLKANDEKIEVKRLFCSLEVPVNEIIEIKQISKHDIDGSVRTFGSGGLFGYLGRFRNDRLGSYTMYATELNNLILIRTCNKIYVFSCSRPKEFTGHLCRKSSAIKNRGADNQHFEK